MDIHPQAVILDGLILALVAKEPQYGYSLNQAIEEWVAINESSMYPTLRRLTKEGLLTTYDEPYEGRLRRYYNITELGEVRLAELRGAWQHYAHGIDRILGEG
jgi:PadR family transcriptional regulator PadR